MQLNTIRNLPCMEQIKRNISIYSLQRNKKTLEENNHPIKYLGSRASVWKAKQSTGGNSENMPWFQPLVVSGSLAVFLLYFCVLREENDIDLKLETSLFEHVPGLEETQLVVAYRYNKENALDVREIEQRMKELGIHLPDANTP